MPCRPTGSRTDRPSEDVDLFTAWERRGDFATAADAVIDGYRDGGYAVAVTQRFDTFARLAVTDPTQPDHPYKVELAANWRALPPVMMDIGQVLHADDVVAGKMSALYTRAEPRDFLDVDAAVTTGRYTRTRLLELAEHADAGFDRRILADLFGMLERYPDRRFAAYSADPAHIAAMRERFAQWREQLLADKA
jgi:Nucleotidyl transferase AbiEii toxin, Type IV TA system